MSASITFLGKPVEVYDTDGDLVRRSLKVPEIKRSHCDMAAFRQSRRFGPYANSDLFRGMVTRELRALGIGRTIDTNNPPDAVTLDESGFLVKATITFPEK